MLRVGYSLVRALWLLRCAYSVEARQELRTYRENTPEAEQMADLIGALFGLVMLGFIVFCAFEGLLVFYDLATAKQDAP